MFTLKGLNGLRIVNPFKKTVECAINSVTLVFGFLPAVTGLRTN